jgi:predicted DNA-binding protein (UPF0251 family)
MFKVGIFEIYLSILSHVLGLKEASRRVGLSVSTLHRRVKETEAKILARLADQCPMNQDPELLLLYQ